MTACLPKAGFEPGSPASQVLDRTTDSEPDGATMTVTVTDSLSFTATGKPEAGNLTRKPGLNLRPGAEFMPA